MVENYQKRNKKTMFFYNLTAVHHLFLQLKEYHNLVEALIDDDLEKQISNFNSFYIDHLLTNADPFDNQMKEYSEFITYQIVPCVNGYMRMNRYNLIHIVRSTGINFIKEIFQISLKALSENPSTVLANGHFDNNDGKFTSTSPSEMKMSSIISILSKENWFCYLETLLSSIVNGLDHMHRCLRKINQTIVDYYAKEDLKKQTESTVEALSLEMKKLDKDFRQVAQLQLKNILITRYSVYLNGNPSSLLDDASEKNTNRKLDCDEKQTTIDVMRVEFSEIVELSQLLAPFQQLVYESWKDMGELVTPMNVNEPFNPIMSQVQTGGPTPRGSPIEISLFINYLTNIFLKRLHEDKKSKMNLLLVKEQWVPCVVPDYIQKLADHLHDVTKELSEIKSAYPDSSPQVNRETLTRRIFSDFDSYLFQMNSLRNYEPGKTSDTILQTREIIKKEKCTGSLTFPSLHHEELPREIWSILGSDVDHIDDFANTSYILVNGVLLFLPIIIDYLKIVRRNLADLYKIEILPVYFKSRDEIGINFCEIFTNILSTFNSRMVQLILGAEARKSVGNSISSRHLALAVRSMEFVLSIVSRITILYEHDFGIPQMHSLRIHQPRSPFSIVERNMRSHIRDLYSKLLMVLTSRFEIRLNNWSPKPPIPTPEILETAKYMTKFTNAISDILSPKFTQALLICAHKQFKMKISTRIKQLEISIRNGPVYNLVEEDLGYYLSEFVNLLPVLEGFEEKFAEIWT